MTSEISKAARAAFNVGFDKTTNVLLLAASLSIAAVLAALVHAIIVRPPVILTTTDGWKCQIATTPRVALCRIPQDPLPRQ